MLNKIYTILFLGVAVIGKAQTAIPLNLLPVPANIEMLNGSFRLTGDFTVGVHTTAPDTILIKAVNRMYQTLNRRTTLYFKTKYIRSNDKSDTAALQITVSKPVLPSPGTDESYDLTVNGNKIILKATTTAGALHGLQTIQQLLSHNENGEFYFPAVTIKDAPRFQWRGLMIDVARHFIPVDVLKRNIEAMAAVKMNVLHLHLTDNEGFRIESKLFPQLQHKGSNGDFYTQAQMKELISFAEERGIIIVPEFDMPGHTKSWFAGYPELASAPGPYEPGPPVDLNSLQQKNVSSIMQLMTTAPIPAFDPTKENTYQFIDKFIAEMAGLFPASYIHIGADENNGVAWKNNPAIVAFMKAHNIPDTHALQAYFVGRVRKIITEHHKQMIGWEELFSKNIAKDVTVQVWQNAAYTKQALNNNNPVLISKGFYLDLFMPAHFYYNNPDIPSSLADSIASGLKGGEAAQWTEVADKSNIETRIWPRAAAIAERLWSPAEVNDVDNMYRRLFIISQQLDEAGLQHISAYERCLRGYAEDEFFSLKTLTDVLTPVKGYKKLFARITMPESISYQTAPLVQVSDIVPLDSKVKWEFRWAVKSYLERKDTVSENIIRNYLMLWQKNNRQLGNLLMSSAQLKLIQQHSKNLSTIAGLGLEALDKIKAGGAVDAAWVNDKLGILKTANTSYGETELCIVPEIESLVKQQLTPLPVTYPMF